MMLEFDRYYHIYNHANGGDLLFKEEKNYVFFLDKYKKHLDPIVDTIAWCLMPNHFHLLVRIKTEEEIFSYFEEEKRNEDVRENSFSRTHPQPFPKFQTLEKVKSSKKELSPVNVLPSGSFIDEKFLSKQFANFFSSYTQAFNKVYGRRGSLFIKNFKRKRIDSDSYFRNLILYIHLNPIHHGFRKHVLEWPWSSFLEFEQHNDDLLRAYFGDVVNYRELHQLRTIHFEEYNQLELDIGA